MRAFMMHFHVLLVGSLLAQEIGEVRTAFRFSHSDKNLKFIASNMGKIVGYL